MQAKASLDGCEVLGMLGEFGKQFHLDGAQERPHLMGVAGSEWDDVAAAQEVPEPGLAR